METKNRLSDAAWEPLLVEQASSGLSVDKFCQVRGLKRTSFYAARKRWKSMLTASDIPADSMKSAKANKSAQALQASTTSEDQAFVAVRITSNHSATPNAMTYADHTCTTIRVVLRSGRELRVDPGFHHDHLRQLVTVLESLS